MSDTVKIIIEMPKEDYEFTKGAETARVFPSEYYVKLILNGTPIPDNATNGDVIKAMFPKVKFEEYEDEVHHCIIAWFFGDFYTGSFPWTWWNTPYKAESEE